MNSSNTFSETNLVVPPLPLEVARPAAILKGSARGLDIVVHGRATVDAITSALIARLTEAPGFFKGSDARIRVEDGPLPSGCLGRLDQIATEFDLRIVEVGAVEKVRNDGVPRVQMAAGSAPAPVLQDEEITMQGPPPSAPVPEPEVTDVAIELASIAAHIVAPVVPEPVKVELELEPERTRVVVGPVRSGVILEHQGHLIVFGDVNPGAEVRAEGNIVVLGRLRGTAHAGIGSDVGFILALRLEPQQLRICRMVARAGDSETPGTEPEIAYLTGDTITVENYQGRLPRNLAHSI